MFGKTNFFKFLVCFLTLTFPAFSAITKDSKGKRIVSGELICKFKPKFYSVMANNCHRNTKTGIEQLDVLNKKYGCNSIKPLFPNKNGLNHETDTIGLSRVYSFSFKIKRTDLIISEYINTGCFEYVEPNFAEARLAGSTVTCATLPNDTYFYRQWALHNEAKYDLKGTFTPKNDADIDMPEAWEITKGDSSILIAVLDAGINIEHPEFGGKNIQTF